MPAVSKRVRAKMARKMASQAAAMARRMPAAAVIAMDTRMAATVEADWAQVIALVGDVEKPARQQ